MYSNWHTHGCDRDFDRETHRMRTASMTALPPQLHLCSTSLPVPRTSERLMLQTLVQGFQSAPQNLKDDIEDASSIQLKCEFFPLKPPRISNVRIQVKKKRVISLSADIQTLLSAETGSQSLTGQGGRHRCGHFNTTASAVRGSGISCVTPFL